MSLLSGEAELHGMLKGATQTKVLISVMADFAEKVEATVCFDASAAVGTAHGQVPWEDKAHRGPVPLDTARSEGG